MEVRMKKKIALIIFSALMILYACMFCYAREYKKKPVIKYYSGKEAFTYDGIEYRLSADIMSESELVKNYDVKKEQLASYVYSTPNIEYEYIIITRNRKRVGESVCNINGNSLVSKYIVAGGWSDVEEVLNSGELLQKQDLEMGQEVEDYEVYIANPNNCSNKIDIEKQTFYYEFTDFSGQQYLSWVRVLN